MSKFTIGSGVIRTSNNPVSTRPTWVKPSDWPDLPTITSSDNKFAGLYAVWPNQDNFCTIGGSCNNGNAGYTVDWGDGVVENFGAGVVAYHNYDYNNSNITTVCSRGYKIVTVVVTPQNLSHNFWTFSLGNKHNQAGLINGYTSGWLDYAFSTYSIGATNLSLTSQSGVAHRMVERVKLININGYQATNGLFSGYTSLQTVSMPANTSSFTSTANMFAGCAQLSYVPLFDTSNVTTASGMFSGCYALQSIPAFNFSKVTNFNSVFVNCVSLQSIPLLDTANSTSMVETFKNCVSLKTIPLLNTANVANMYGTFSECLSLQSLPLLDTRNVTNMALMFRTSWGGTSLTTVPLFNTANVANMAFMFEKNYCLTTVPLFNTSKVTDMQYMFSNDYQSVSALQSVPNFDTANVTNMQYMFRYNQSMTTAPEFNTANVTNMDSMFIYCAGLQTVPSYNTSKVRNMNNMFFGCTRLQTVPSMDTANCQVFNGMFQGCSSLAAIPSINVSNTIVTGNYTGMFTTCQSLANVSATGFKYSFSVASCRLSNTALNFIYTNLPTVTGQSITITSNYGANTSNTTIANSKGWAIIN